MSTKRVSSEEPLSQAIPPFTVRQSKRGKVENIASASLEESALEIRKASSLSSRRVTFAPSAKSISTEEIRQIHANFRHAIDGGQDGLDKATLQIPNDSISDLLNQDFHQPTFPVMHAINKLSNQPVPVEVFDALFNVGFWITNLHLFSMWDILDAKSQDPKNERDLKAEKLVLTGLFLQKMPKKEVIKTLHLFWKAICVIPQKQLPGDHPKVFNLESAFELLIQYSLEKGFEKYSEHLIQGFKEIASSDLEEVAKIHDFDKKLMNILYQNLAFALESGKPIFGIRTLVDIICVIKKANPEYSSTLGQAFLLKYLKTPVNLEILTVILCIPIQIDPQHLGESMKELTPEVQVLLKEKFMIAK